MDDLTEDPPLNPFANPDGGEPSYYVDRGVALRELHSFAARVEAGRFPGAICIQGNRGCGKTVELYRWQGVLLQLGALPVLVCLKPLHKDAKHLQAYVRHALARQLERPPGPPARRWGFNVSIPFTPIDVSYETSGRPRDDLSIAAMLEEHFAAGAQRPPCPIVFLIDEGDFLTAASYEAAFAALLHQASLNDYPVGVVVAGTGIRLRYAMQGLSTFMADSYQPVVLTRLSAGQSIDLLVETAQKAGVAWSAESLAVLADACHGIPRYLQLAGRRLFEGESGCEVTETALEGFFSRSDGLLSSWPEAGALAVAESVLDGRSMPYAEFWGSVTQVVRGDDHLPNAINKLFFHHALEFVSAYGVALGPLPQQRLSISDREALLREVKTSTLAPPRWE